MTDEEEIEWIRYWAKREADAGGMQSAAGAKAWITSERVDFNQPVSEEFIAALENAGARSELIRQIRADNEKKLKGKH